MTDLHIFAKDEGLRDTEWECDGRQYGWGNNRGLVLMKSNDLINWTRTNMRVDQAFEGLENIGCAWAPQTTYDAKKKKLMLYFTMRFENGLNKLYYANVSDEFTRLETKPELLFTYPKGNVNYIDADITKVGKEYHMFYVSHEEGAGIKQAVSKSVNEGYVYDPKYYDPEGLGCEAPNVWKRIGEERWVLMYDVYRARPNNMGFSETTDFKTFADLGLFNNGVMKTTNFQSPKHGAVIHVTKKEADNLRNYWKEKQ
ncbi:MAG: glycoside hydrolase family 43 protein [Marinilabiliaceae bacterium]|nr:glycoside hydrolase family 43 protein [Marinilabiliaceae bacterium]